MTTDTSTSSIPMPMPSLGEGLVGPAWCYCMHEKCVPMIGFETPQRLEAFPYSRLKRTHFDPSMGLTLEFDDNRVIIRGFALQELCRLVIEQRVSLVRQSTEHSSHEGVPQVDSILLPPPPVTGVRSG